MKKIPVIIVLLTITAMSYSQIDLAAFQYDADIPFKEDVGIVFSIPAEEKDKEFILFTSGSRLFQCLIDKNGGPVGMVSEIDLESFGLKSISEVHPFNRFASEWIVLFIGSDGEGNRALYGMKPRIPPEKAEYFRYCELGKDAIENTYKAINTDFADFEVMVETPNDFILVDVKKKLGYDHYESVSLNDLFGFQSMLPSKLIYQYLPTSRTISVVLLADDGSGNACHEILLKGIKVVGHDVVGTDVSDFSVSDPGSQDSAFETMTVKEAGDSSLYIKQEGKWVEAYKTKADILFAWTFGGASGLSLIVEQGMDGNARYSLVDSIRDVTTILHEEAGAFFANLESSLKCERKTEERLCRCQVA